MAKSIVHSEKVIYPDGSLIIIREKHMGSGRKHYWARALGRDVGKYLHLTQEYKAIRFGERMLPCIRAAREKAILETMANLPPATPDGGDVIIPAPTGGLIEDVIIGSEDRGAIARWDDDGGVEAPVFYLPEPAST